MSRTSPEAESKANRRGVEIPPSSNFCLTNFAPTSAFHAVGYQSSLNFPLIFPEGDPKTTRRNSEQRWEKGRSWSGVGRYLNGLFLGTKGTVNSPLSYRECTERYQKGTGNVLKSYWRYTKEVLNRYELLVDLGYKSDTVIVQPAKREDTGLVDRRGNCHFKFDGFKVFSEGVISVIESCCR
jgi:hypothetical protein